MLGEAETVPVYLKYMLKKHNEKKLLTIFVVFVFSLLYNLKSRHLSPLPPAVLYAFLEGEDNCRGEDINLLRGFFFFTCSIRQ